MPQLTQYQRCQICVLKKSGDYTQDEIAEMIGASQPTISREIKRNSGQRGYRYKQAQQKTEERRHQASTRPRKMTPELIAMIERLIREDQFSPEQVSGHLKRIYGISISYECIYRYIWWDKRNGGNLYKNLRRCGKKYNKRGGKLAGRGLIPDRVGIEMRPLEVADKLRVGDFEGDTIVGANHRGAIISLVDRKTKLILLRLISSPKAEETAQGMIDALTSLRGPLHTLTTDNGKEFSKHEYVAATLNVQFFFANAYCSWERGLNENTNGLVRQYFPKGCDFTKLTEEDVLEVEKKLNSRPRKTLGYSTPNEEYFSLTGTLPFYAFQC